MQTSLRITLKELFEEWQRKPLPKLYLRDASKLNLKKFDNILAII